MRTHPGPVSICAVIAFALFFGGCEAREREPTPREPVTDQAKAVSDDSNRFAFDLYAQVRDGRDGNLFLSPYSISTAMGMTYAGARGETQAQMAQVLHFNQPEPQLHSAMGALARDLDATGKNRAYQLSVANRLWVGDVELQGSYIKTTRDAYGAEAAQLDFAADAEGSRRTINQWVAKQTNDRIRDLIAPGTIDRDTSLVLTNAVYFKGRWADEFDKADTEPLPFHLDADTQVDTPLMCTRDSFRFMEAESVKVLELPYKDGDLSMLIILPAQIDGLADIERQLSAEQLDAWLAQLERHEVAVWLPRFRMTSTTDLGQTLIDMGMPLAFTIHADFTGMDRRGELKISTAVHKAFVEVNEEGTEAAAATGVTITAASIAMEFRADHPFVFLIRDEHTGVILFMGRLVNPDD